MAHIIKLHRLLLLNQNLTLFLATLLCDTIIFIYSLIVLIDMLNMSALLKFRS